MKALKLKSSTKENPIWGEVKEELYYDYIKRESIITSSIPELYGDLFTMDMFNEGYLTEFFHDIDQWELVTVKITIA